MGVVRSYRRIPTDESEKIMNIIKVYKLFNIIGFKPSQKKKKFFF